MRALSTNRGRPSVLGIFWRCALRAPGNGNATAVLADALVLHVAADQREQRVVAADAHAGARHDLGPALPDDDRAGVDKLATIDLDTEHLRVRVAAVPRRAAAFLVCQLLGLLLRCAPSSRRLLGSLFRLLGRNGLFGSRLGPGRRFLLRSGLAPPSLPGGLGPLLLLLLSFQTDTADGDDLEGRQVGPPAVMHPHALFGLVADALGARPATVRDHLRVHVDAVDGGISNFDLVAVAEQQDAREVDRRTGLGGQAVDQDPVAEGHAVLLPAAHDHSRRFQGLRGDGRTIWLRHGDRVYQDSSPFMGRCLVLPISWGGGLVLPIYGEVARRAGGAAPEGQGQRRRGRGSAGGAG